MNCSITELCEKNVVEIGTGDLLGRIGDIEFDTETGAITCLVIFSRQKMLGFGKSEGDIRFSWKDISVIGEDTILICCEVKPQVRKPPKPGGLKGIFS
ncbi:MAG: YlmC/YmxH family sporulation protein [Clostridia bacterium]|nr:YlmC/YmxH family sporulation protein [Clostridia bacterium]MBR5427593.1 YlmC/YmxH family sporulation protein [Clostridia bacterium]